MSLRPCKPGFYLLDQQESHLEHYYGKDTRKFGYSGKLSVRISDNSYSTYSAPRSVTYAFTAETASEEDARRLESFMKQWLKEHWEWYPAGSSREFIRMNVEAVKEIVTSIARETDIRIEIVDSPTYVRPPARLCKRNRSDEHKVVLPLHAKQRILNLLPKKEFSSTLFRLFLETEAQGSNGPLSADNVAQVVRNVSLLMSGQGVGSRGWIKPFRKDAPVRLQDDLKRLKTEAATHITLYGSDPREGKGKSAVRALAKKERYDASNGWKLNHPIEKMQQFKAWLQSTKK